MGDNSLPIAACRDALMAKVLASDCLVVIGDTGSGKTTQLPQYLDAAGLTAERPLIITQPRRVAAISVAERVAFEMKTRVGGVVGYQVRFDSKTSAETRIKYATDGTLLRECLEDPTLQKYSAVLLDEAHVRSLDTDILFGLVKRFVVRRQKKHKGHFPKLLIMSATLEHEKFSEFFHCDVFHVPGRMHHVDIIYRDLITEQDMLSVSYVKKAVDVVLDIHRECDQGDILVFLTGRAEIDRACDFLFMASERIDYDREVACREVDGMMILPVYGAMPTENQRRIFSPAPPGIRKVIIATDIASTSLTVDGICYVVDSGYCKQKEFNAHTGLDALRVVPISRSEAQQRAGRAGRTRAGECHRLYSKSFEEKVMLEFTPPELQRTSLTSVVLTLKSLGIHDVLRFPYLDPPEEVMLLEALRQLYYFDAIDRNGRVTELGRRMNEFPLPPSLARVLMHASEEPFVDAVIDIVSMLSVEVIFIRPGGEQAAQEASLRHRELALNGGDDFNALLYIMRCVDASRDVRLWCREWYIHFRAVTTAQKVRDQLRQLLQQRRDRPLRELLSLDEPPPKVQDDAETAGSAEPRKPPSPLGKEGKTTKSSQGSRSPPPSREKRNRGDGRDRDGRRSERRRGSASRSRSRSYVPPMPGMDVSDGASVRT
eukprot:m.191144 g.191144  ORF g.191144 m.191144 type:complete len:657 (+) comp10591_c2_seq6:77-2047(+)